ncbi:MAG: hypothetical protein MI975_09520 [Cytophagales bacterium]|nr:hypothetical protein [Cytophagales bacterium]
MIEKKIVINYLTICVFPIIGISTYVSGTISPTIGFLFSCIPSILIIIIFLVESIYQEKIPAIFNGYHLIFLLFITTSIIALFVSYKRGYPDLSITVVFLRSLRIFTIFLSFVIFAHYNKDDRFIIVNILFKSLVLLLGINIIGYYGLGLTAPFRQIEGRINFPFSGGVYGANMIIIPLIFLTFSNILKTKFTDKPFLKIGYGALLILCLYIFYTINARLFLLTFIVVVLIFSLNLQKAGILIPILSVFTLPVLVSLRLILPKFLTIGPLEYILQRIDYRSFITFQGRLYLWEPAMDWLKSFGDGVYFGNGWNGQYFLRLAEKYNFLSPGFLTINKHLHSTTLDVLVSQGIFGYLILLIIYIVLVYHYNLLSKKRSELKFLYMTIIFIVLLSHYDVNVSVSTIGFFITSFLYANISRVPNA